MQTIGYQNPKHKITTRYSVEYLCASSDGGAKRWQLYQHATERGSSFEPWELLDKLEFEDAGAAWQFYLARLLDEHTFVVRPIFEEIFIDGELAREVYIEEDSSFHWNLRGWVDRETRDELDKARKEAKSSGELLADYAEFVRKPDGAYHGKIRQMFDEFHNQKEKERRG